jgi:sulfide:quinone oxidoreductase
MKHIAGIVEPLFRARGIKLSVNFNVKEITGAAIHSYEGESLEFDLAVIVPPHGVGKAIEEAGLAKDKWVAVDRHTLRVAEHENIFALGDVTALGVPKTGAVAHFQAQTVVEGLMAEIRRKGRVRPYSGRVLCLVETGGGRATVMEFDYDTPARPSQPRRFYHWAKSALDRFYWIAIPSGRM